MSMRSRNLGIWIVGLIVVLAAGLVWLLLPAKPPNIDDLGGMVLVYQIAEGPNADSLKMAETLQRRFHHHGLRHVSVRPGEPKQIEILIPRLAGYSGDVLLVKALIAKVGDLEFRVLANSVDDEAGIAAAQRQINATPQEKLEADAIKGRPPAGPLAPGKDDLEVFAIALPRNVKCLITYSWVELAQQELVALNLDASAKADPNRVGTWVQAATNRYRAGKLKDYGGVNSYLLQGALFYSRDCQNANLSEQDRRDKGVEYFVLARNPEIDPSTGKPASRIEGRYLAGVSADGPPGKRLVTFSLDDAGANLISTLTRKNLPSERDGTSIRRHLAIVFDGQVVTAPTINSEIHGHGQIAGAFTDREVESMVSILGAGALPAHFLPTPVRETVVEPKK